MQSQQQNKIPVNVGSSLENIDTALKKYTSKDATLDDKRKAILVFQQNLKNSEKKVRIAAANALIAIGTGADEALDDLKDLLKTERDRDVLSCVIAAIQSINAKPAISELTDIFKDEQQNLQVRSLAAEALKTTAADAEQAKEFIP